mgnify:CR=1 FL=1
MLKIKKIFKPILVFILIIPIAIIFCACGDNKKDDKLTNTSNIESSKKTENNENTVTFPVKEFKNILTAINYANKICKNYSFIANGGRSMFLEKAIQERRQCFLSNICEHSASMSRMIVLRSIHGISEMPWFAQITITFRMVSTRPRSSWNYFLEIF